MVMKVDARMVEAALERCGFDEYTHDGIEAIIEYYDSIDDELIFEPEDFHNLWVEYGDGCKFDWDDFDDDFGHLIDDMDYYTPDDIIARIPKQDIILAKNGNVITRKD